MRFSKDGSDRREKGEQPGFVYFDLDDTLLDHGDAERAALRDLVRDLLKLDTDPDVLSQVQEVYRVRNRQLWAEYSGGRIRKEELRRRRFEQIAAEYGAGRSWSELDTFYMNRYAEHWRPVDGALAVFADVARHYPVGIITNGFADTQRAKLERFPEIRRTSRSVVISEEVGHLKPDPRLFAFAAECAGVQAGSILYVGDSLTSDVHGALSAGWRAAWFTDGEAPADLSREVFVFRSWCDFGSWLLD